MAFEEFRKLFYLIAYIAMWSSAGLYIIPVILFLIGAMSTEQIPVAIILFVDIALWAITFTMHILFIDGLALWTGVAVKDEEGNIQCKCD